MEPPLCCYHCCLVSLVVQDAVYICMGVETSVSVLMGPVEEQACCDSNHTLTHTPRERESDRQRVLVSKSSFLLGLSFSSTGACFFRRSHSLRCCCCRCHHSPPARSIFSLFLLVLFWWWHHAVDVGDLCCTSMKNT